MTDPRDELGPTRSAARAEHQLRAVLGARELGERGRDIGRDHLVELAAEVGEERAVPLQVLGLRSGEAVGGRDVEAEELTVGTLGHARAAPDQRLGSRRAGDRDEHALARLPWLGDAVALAVLLERFVDSVGHPEQRQLAQGREVAGSEVVAERGVDLLGLVDVAVGHAAPQGLGRHVDELDLLGLAHDGIGDRLALGDAGDALDDVVHRLEMLDVERRDHVDARVEQLLDVLPPFRVPRSRDVRVRELVDEHDLGPPGEDRVDVHLLERPVTVFELPAGNGLQVADLFGRVDAAVRLDVADHDVGAAIVTPPALVEHGEGLADAGRGPQIDPQVTARHIPVSRADPPTARRSPLGSR